MGIKNGPAKISEHILKTKGSTFSLSFFIAMAIYMTIIVMVGFWPSYFGHYLFGQELVESGPVKITWKVHIHAIVFMLWMALLLYQTFLVARGKTIRHMTIGRYGFIIGILVVGLGLFMAYLRTDSILTIIEKTWSEIPMYKFFLDHPFVIISEFAVLLVLGFYYRTIPAVHKRYMLFATIAIMSAGASRIGLFGEPSTAIFISSAFLPIWIYDVYLDKKIHRATLIGTAIVSVYILKYYLL